MGVGYEMGIGFTMGMGVHYGHKADINLQTLYEQLILLKVQDRTRRQRRIRIREIAFQRNY